MFVARATTVHFVAGPPTTLARPILAPHDECLPQTFAKDSRHKELAKGEEALTVEQHSSAPVSDPPGARVQGQMLGRCPGSIRTLSKT